MLLRSLMFLVWALVAGTSVFWGFKLMAQPLPVPAGAAVAAVEATGGGPLSALLGVKRPPPAPLADEPPPPAPESSRFQLIGVVAARNASQAQGLALIAVDGKAPRAFRVGAVVDGDLVLQSVLPRAASIGPRGGVALVSLELPPLPPPATGVPGAVPAQPGAAPMPLQPALPSPVPLSAPMPIVGPSGMPITNPTAPARLRAQRFATQPGGADTPGAGVPPQDAVLPAETVAPIDHRQQR